MKRIMLKKEIFQGENQTFPYREFDLEYFEENYLIIVDEMIVGNSSGKYKVKIYLQDFGKKELIYQYDFNGDIKPLKNEEIKNKDFADVVKYLVDNEIIKKITPAKSLV